MSEKIIKKLFVAYFIFLFGVSIWVAILNPRLFIAKEKKAKIELTEEEIISFEKLSELKDTCHVEN